MPVSANAPARCITQVYVSPGNLHTASINSICWAPYELGLCLVAGSSDGSVSVLEHTQAGTWDTIKVRTSGSLSQCMGEHVTST